MLNRHLISVLSLLAFVVAQVPCVAIAQDATSLQVESSPNSTSTIGLTLEDLDKLQQTEFTTSTIWTDGQVKFSGVSLNELLKTLKISGQTIELIALNDYSISIPMSELGSPLPIVATRMNDKRMSVRDKGPFWLVYDYDSDASFQNETIYSRSIWQLNRIKLVE